MADTDAPGCRRLQICLRERPHVIGKPRPPTAALLSLPHYCCPTRLRYLWGTCTYGNHSAHCCRDWLLGLTMTVCRRRKSRSRIGAWASSGTMCKTTRRLFWERLGVWMLILCAHTAPCLSPCVCSYYSLSVSLCVLTLLLVCLPVCWLEQCGRALVHCAHARAQ